MVLTGTFSRTIDTKQRIAIPKRLRDEFAAGENPAMFVAPGTDGSLTLYTEERFALLATRLTAASPAEEDVRAFSRLFYAQAQRVEFDRQGRLRIPAELAELAGLRKESVLLGVFDHLEIWDKRRWDEYLADKRGHYDKIAEAALRKDHQRANGPVV
jgi:MraZ protein